MPWTAWEKKQKEQLATFSASFPIDDVYGKLEEKATNSDYLTTGIL